MSRVIVLDEHNNNNQKECVVIRHEPLANNKQQTTEQTKRSEDRGPAASVQHNSSSSCSSPSHQIMKRLSQVVETADVKLQRMKMPSNGNSSNNNDQLIVSSIRRSSSPASANITVSAANSVGEEENNNDESGDDVDLKQQHQRRRNKQHIQSPSRQSSLLVSSVQLSSVKTTPTPTTTNMFNSGENNNRWWSANTTKNNTSVIVNNVINNNHNNNGNSNGNNNCEAKDKNSFDTTKVLTNNIQTNRDNKHQQPIIVSERRHSDLPCQQQKSNLTVTNNGAHYYNNFHLCHQQQQNQLQQWPVGNSQLRNYQTVDGMEMNEEDDDQSITPTPQLFATNHQFTGNNNYNAFITNSSPTTDISYNTRASLPLQSIQSVHQISNNNASNANNTYNTNNNNNDNNENNENRGSSLIGSGQLKLANSCQSGLVKPIVLSPFKGLVRQHRISVPCDLTSARKVIKQLPTTTSTTTTTLRRESIAAAASMSPKRQQTQKQRNNSNGNCSSRFNFINSVSGNNNNNNNKGINGKMSSANNATDLAGKLIPETGYKIVVFGASGVGKTSVIKRFMYDVFDEKHRPTVEDNFFIEFPFDKYLFNINVTDTSGTYQFPAMRRLAINSGDAFILVYSVDDPESFEELTRIHDMIVEERQKAYEQSPAYQQMVASSTPRSSDSGISCNTCQENPNSLERTMINDAIEQQQQQRIDMNATPVNIYSHGHLNYNSSNHQYHQCNQQHQYRQQQQQQQEQLLFKPHVASSRRNSCRHQNLTTTDLSPIKSLPTDSSDNENNKSDILNRSLVGGSNNNNSKPRDNGLRASVSASDDVVVTAQQQQQQQTITHLGDLGDLGSSSNSSCCGQSVNEHDAINGHNSCYCGESNCSQLLCRVACNIKKFGKVVSRHGSNSSLSISNSQHCDHNCNEFNVCTGASGSSACNTNQTGDMSSRKSSYRTNCTTSSTTTSRKSSAASATEAYLRTRRTLKPPMVIVANKSDLPLEQHLVDSNSIEALVLIDWDNGFCKASARNNDNISEIFQKLLLQAKQPPTMAEALISERRRSLPPMPMSEQQRNMAKSSHTKHRYYKFVRSLLLSSLRPLSRNSSSPGNGNHNGHKEQDNDTDYTNNISSSGNKINNITTNRSYNNMNETNNVRCKSDNKLNCNDEDRRHSCLLA